MSCLNKAACKNWFLGKNGFRVNMAVLGKNINYHVTAKYFTEYSFNCTS